MDVGDHFGDYRLDAVLGRGGMGVVYSAFDEVHERRVALKVLAPALADDQHYQSRFLHESRTVAGLSSPHIIPIHTFGVTADRLYLDMALVSGRDLGAVLAEGRLEPARAVTIVEQVADALEAAHEQGLVHRDVKPGNVLLTERRHSQTDFVYLCDFGLARPVAGGAGLTMTGTVMGTVDYMPPEQIEARPLDHRADIYALGCLLFHILAGYPPFRAESQVQVMDAHRLSAIPRLPAPSGAAWDAMDATIATALAKDPRDRFASAGALAGAAREALASQQSPARSAPSAAETVVAVPRSRLAAGPAVGTGGSVPVSDQVTQAPATSGSVTGAGAGDWTGEAPPAPTIPAGPPAISGPLSAPGGRSGQDWHGSGFGPGGPWAAGQPSFDTQPPPVRRGLRRPGVLIPLVVAAGLILLVVVALIGVAGVHVVRFATTVASPSSSGSGIASSDSPTPSGASSSTPSPSPSSTLSAAEQALLAQLPADATDCESSSPETYDEQVASAELYCGLRHLDGGYLYAYSYADTASRDRAFSDFTQLSTDDQGPCPTIDGSGPWHTASGAVGGTAACYLVDETSSSADATSSPSPSTPAPQHAVMAWTDATAPIFAVVAVQGQPDLTPAYTWHVRYVAQESP